MGFRDAVEQWQRQVEMWSEMQQMVHLSIYMPRLSSTISTELEATVFIKY